jgi:hypothetical protein
MVRGRLVMAPVYAMTAVRWREEVDIKCSSSSWRDEQQ